MSAEAPHVALKIAGELPRAVLLVGESHHDLGTRRDRTLVQRVAVIDRGVDGTRPEVKRAAPLPEGAPTPIVRIAGEWPIGALALQT